MPKKYDKEFKINAVRLVLEEKLPEVCQDLGIGKSTLEKWKRDLKQHGLSAFQIQDI